MQRQLAKEGRCSCNLSTNNWDLIHLVWHIVIKTDYDLTQSP